MYTLHLIRLSEGVKKASSLLDFLLMLPNNIGVPIRWVLLIVFLLFIQALVLSPLIENFLVTGTECCELRL